MVRVPQTHPPPVPLRPMRWPKIFSSTKGMAPPTPTPTTLIRTTNLAITISFVIPSKLPTPTQRNPLLSPHRQIRAVNDSLHTPPMAASTKPATINFP